MGDYDEYTDSRVEVEMHGKLYGFRKIGESEVKAQARMLCEAEMAINEKPQLRYHIDAGETFKDKKVSAREGRINGGILMGDFIIAIVLFLFIPAFVFRVIDQPWGTTWFIVTCLMCVLSLTIVGYHLGKGRCFKCHQKLRGD